MNSGEYYVIPEGADDEWVRPQPVDDLVLDAVIEHSEYDEDELDGLSSYIDLDELVALFEDDTDTTDLSFAVEDLDVTVYETGEVDVEV